ncbi:hypothetical protein [Frankia gtarii]|nr:hypothetical protein [Frankia gtarii]
MLRLMADYRKIGELKRAWFNFLIREPTESLPNVAAQALVDGIDGDALREIAGLSNGDDSAARELLPVAMAELGFEVPPSDAPLWERVRTLVDPTVVDRLEWALGLVQRDLTATAPEIGRLRLRPLAPFDEDIEIPVAISLPDGNYSADARINANSYSTTLASVAGGAQESLMEVSFYVWPSCAHHDRGMYVQVDRSSEKESDSVNWMCKAAGGHILCAIGDLRVSR